MLQVRVEFVRRVIDLINSKEYNLNDKLTIRLHKARSQWKEQKLSCDELLAIIPNWLAKPSIKNINYLLKFCKSIFEIKFLIDRFCDENNKPDYITIIMVRKINPRYALKLIRDYKIYNTYQQIIKNTRKK